jgi:hypothetical protein
MEWEALISERRSSHFPRLAGKTNGAAAEFPHGVEKGFPKIGGGSAVE